MTSCYFERHMIDQCSSYDLIQVPLQFSTGVSSSGGIILCIKSRLFFDIIVYLMYN